MFVLLFILLITSLIATVPVRIACHVLRFENVTWSGCLTFLLIGLFGLFFVFHLVPGLQDIGWLKFVAAFAVFFGLSEVILRGSSRQSIALAIVSAALYGLQLTITLHAA